MPQNVEEAAPDGERLPEWHFHQPVFDAELQKIRAEREKLAAEEVAAKEQQARAEREAHEEEERLMHAATQADSARVAEFSALRDRLAEVKEAADELFQECDRQTEALGDQSNAARERRYAHEVALRTPRLPRRKEAEKVASIMQQIEKLEQSHERSMQEKDCLAFQRRDATKNNIARIYRQLEIQSSQLDSALQNELQIVYDSHLQVQSQILKGMEEQWNGRQQALSAAENDIRGADRKINAGLLVTHSKVLDSGQKAHQQVMELQARDFAIEDMISHKVQSAVANMDEAVAAKQRSDNTQLDSVQRRQGATEALGKVFPRTTQMNLFGVKPGQSRLASKAWAVMGD
eukprot:TRINITY_DN23237_c0_g1_i2.p1 TRINITY_DN23237_c0_g1~~TRINITY_DN23237_c0_g1_i2.p1  ORF type:complete len:348 (-),score=94.91 TRINITY_DN23237_c0_g1_i2:62-1105(-)